NRGDRRRKKWVASKCGKALPALQLPSARRHRSSPQQGRDSSAWWQTSAVRLPHSTLGSVIGFAFFCKPKNGRICTPVHKQKWSAYTCTFIGSAEGTELDVVHRDGSITLHGTGLFTGSVNGRSGTFLLSYEGIGNAVTGHETLHFTVGHGTGDLAGLHAELTAE